MIYVSLFISFYGAKGADMRLEDIKCGQILTGIEQGKCCEVIALQLIGKNSATLYYKRDGVPQERMLTRIDEPNISIADSGRPWNFSVPAQDFKRAAEACRISLAYLFDPMMAVHTSNVQPLPHQITAVYESMLPRQPLRYVLADDPGAGKTIMAGLLIRELIMRADAKRILIVSPGSLSEQWYDEMSSKFGLQFELFDRRMLDLSHSGNPFDDHDLLIARLDQLARAEDISKKLFQFITPSTLQQGIPSYQRKADFERVRASFVMFLKECAEYGSDWSQTLDEFEGLDQVSLMTVHKSKGLEFHTMIFYGLDNKTWWSLRPDKHEELNAFFVAFTRAKQRAFFSRCDERGSAISWIEDILHASGVETIDGASILNSM